MVLGQLDDGAQRLLLVLCLPLVDGVFATLLVSGAVETFSDVLSVSLTIFTGAGALAVLYSYSENRKEAISMVKSVSPFLIGGAILVGLVAPIFEQVFNITQLKIAAGLALLVIASEMAGYDLSNKFTVPGIILTGLLLSLQNPDDLTIGVEYLVPAIATVSASLIALYIACYLNSEIMDLNYIRKGGALVLVIIALTMFGLQIPSEIGLGVLMVSFIISIDYKFVVERPWRVLIAA